MNFNPKILIILVVVLLGGCWAASRLATTDMQQVAERNSAIDDELYPTPDISELDGLFGVGSQEAVGAGSPASDNPSMNCQYVGRHVVNRFSFGRTLDGMEVVYENNLFACTVTQ